MIEVARQAATHWGLQDAAIVLAARRENVVFRVAGPAGDLALRLHRPGYRSEAELASELEWMAALARGGLRVPAPIPALTGALTASVGQHVADVLVWLPGAALGRAGELQGVDDRTGFCHELGQAMAQLHGLSDAWQRPDWFTRPAWSREGLLGEAPVWGRFWEHPHLTDKERTLLLETRRRANEMLAGIEVRADYGLIHADLISENMLYDNGRPSLIDFDDGGWGFRDFELATFLLRFTDAPDYADLRAALIEGYGARRPVDAGQLDLFVLLRALTYPGWIMERLGEPGSDARSARAIGTAVTQAWRWLEAGG